MNGDGKEERKTEGREEEEEEVKKKEWHCLWEEAAKSSRWWWEGDTATDHRRDRVLEFSWGNWPSPGFKQAVYV